MRKTRSDYTHIRYEWLDQGYWYASQTLHRLDQHGPAWHGIPGAAKQVPCRYDYEKERWVDVVARETHLPDNYFRDPKYWEPGYGPPID